jgi:hypothetical protein
VFLGSQRRSIVRRRGQGVQARNTPATA